MCAIWMRDLHVFLMWCNQAALPRRRRSCALSSPRYRIEAAGIRPTIYGDGLIECGVAVFDQLKQGIGKIEFLSDPTTGEVRIGCVPSMAATLLPSVIRRSASAGPSGSSRLGQMPKSVWGHGPPSGQSPTRQEDP